MMPSTIVCSGRISDARSVLLRRSAVLPVIAVMDWISWMNFLSCLGVGAASSAETNPSTTTSEARLEETVSRSIRTSPDSPSVSRILRPLT
jgi:hypothetical protein